jgi:hypothetical protein
MAQGSLFVLAKNSYSRHRGKKGKVGRENASL